MSRQYKKKEKALFSINDGENFNNKTFDLFRKDRDCVLAALEVGVSFTHFPQEWLGDKEMSIAFLAFSKIDSDLFWTSTVGTTLLDDKDFAIETLAIGLSRTHLDTYMALSNRLKADSQIASLVLKSEPVALLMMDEELRSNPTVMHAFVDGLFEQSRLVDIDSQSLNITLKQLGLPLNQWNEEGEVDEMHDFIDKRAFSQTLDAQLPDKSVEQQTIKI